MEHTPMRHQAEDITCANQSGISKPRSIGREICSPLSPVLRLTNELPGFRNSQQIQNSGGSFQVLPRCCSDTVCSSGVTATFLKCGCFSWVLTESERGTKASAFALSEILGAQKVKEHNVGCPKHASKKFLNLFCLVKMYCVLFGVFFK